jgi:hypothetical protein
MPNGDMELPSFLKMIMVFIDRVGFPVLAFILMFYMAFVSLGKITVVMDKNATVLTELVTFEKSSYDTLKDLIKENHK